MIELTGVGKTNCRVTDRLTELTGVGDLTKRCAREGLYIFGRVLVSSHQLRIRIKIWNWLLF